MLDDKTRFCSPRRSCGEGGSSDLDVASGPEEPTARRERLLWASDLWLLLLAQRSVRHLLSTTRSKAQLLIRFVRR